MTVSYTAEVATCRGFGCFLKLLVRWRASIYKLVWLDLTLFLFLYYFLSGIYRLILNEDQKRTFESIVMYCSDYNDLIPISFVLGFYVTIVMNRWWNQYMSIPWPDSIAVFVSGTIHGNDERGRLMRRTIVRYVCVCLTMVLRNVAPRVKKRFPTLEHFVDSGLLLENELAIFKHLNAKFPEPSKHWLPIVWASSIVTRARKEGRIRDDFAVKTILDELNKFRGSCGSISQYDNISVPLVYTQVVTLAVYTYFLTTVVGRQWIQKGNPNSNIDLYFPVFAALQFFFYMGWLKVAETLINPFGEDDDDFEVNWIIDRNLQVSYLIVDEMHHEHPELIRDQYWDEIFPTELPYTAAAEPFREEPPAPSTAHIQLTAAQQEVLPSSVKIDEMVVPDDQKYHPDDMADDASGIHFTAMGRLSRSASRVSNRSNRERIASTSGGTTPTFGEALSRVSSVTSVLKRLFSRDDRTDGNTAAPGRTAVNMPSMGSTASLQTRPLAPGGSMRIGVIEEVDEQMTLTSKQSNDNRPHVQSIFAQGPPPPSDPVDVPRAASSYTMFSRSAPARGPAHSTVAGTSESYEKPTLGKQESTQSMRSSATFPPMSYTGSGINDNESRSSIASSSTDSSENGESEFTKLKTERREKRRNRRLGRQGSLNGNQSKTPPDSETIPLTKL